MKTESSANRPRAGRRNHRPYHAVMFSWPNTRGPEATFPTIRACGQWAEKFGATWDRCVVTDREYRRVAEFRRDLRSATSSWFRAYG